jgi:PhnB protein
MATANTYLNFPGNTEEAFNFYKSVFGGEFQLVQRFRDTPFGETLSAEDKQKIMHISLPIGKTSVLMATDALESMGHSLVTGDNFSISIHTETKEEADRLFAGLSEGGKVTVPLEKAVWGDYFGMLKDKFGIQWMLSFVLSKDH